ncbi:unnamed protein product, partial [Amoebophrya sp. A25]|eukprot:GSA25T00019987001.1
MTSLRALWRILTEKFCHSSRGPFVDDTDIVDENTQGTTGTGSNEQGISRTSTSRENVAEENEKDRSRTSAKQHKKKSHRFDFADCQPLKVGVAVGGAQASLLSAEQQMERKGRRRSSSAEKDKMSKSKQQTKMGEMDALLRTIEPTTSIYVTAAPKRRSSDRETTEASQHSGGTLVEDDVTLTSGVAPAAEGEQESTGETNDVEQAAETRPNIVVLDDGSELVLTRGEAARCERFIEEREA